LSRACGTWRAPTPCSTCTGEETGGFTLAGAGEAHLEACLAQLRSSFMGGAEVRASAPWVAFRETVAASPGDEVMCKSTNRANRLYVQARSMDGALLAAIEEGRIGPHGDPQALLDALSEDFGWDMARFGPGWRPHLGRRTTAEEVAGRIWCFGPDSTGPNLLVDVTSVSAPCRAEIGDACIAAMQGVTQEGALAGEDMRGVVFELTDAALQGGIRSDGRHNHPPGQIVPAAHRALYGAQLAARPRLCEPVYLVEIQAPRHALCDVRAELNQRRGEVLEEVQRPGACACSIKAYLPVVESFGFAAALHAATSGEASPPRYAFDHWGVVGSDPLAAGSRANTLVRGIRARKGLRPEIPLLAEYVDKL
jgi:elongation factor 2